MSLKILVTSDHHSDEELLENTIEEANSGEYDLYINLGDYMTEDYAKELFDQIEIPALGTTGNRDMHFSNEITEGETPVYHFLEADIDEEYLLILIGGDFPDDIKEQVEEIIQEHGDSSKVIVGSHYPPKRVGDKVRNGDRVGFDVFRELILKEKPAVWMNGHIHEDYGHRQLMNTEVLNTSSEETRKGYSIELKDEGGVQEIQEVELD